MLITLIYNNDDNDKDDDDEDGNRVKAFHP